MTTTSSSRLLALATVALISLAADAASASDETAATEDAAPEVDAKTEDATPDEVDAQDADSTAEQTPPPCEQVGRMRRCGYKTYDWDGTLVEDLTPASERPAIPEPEPEPAQPSTPAGPAQATTVSGGDAQTAANPQVEAPPGPAQQAAAPRPFLGVATQTLDPNLAQALGLTGTVSGAFVNGVETASPAERAGLRNGDVITRFGATPVATTEDLVNAIANQAPGSSTTVIFMREGRTEVAQVELTSTTDAATASASPSTPQQAQARAKITPDQFETFASAQQNAITQVGAYIDRAEDRSSGITKQQFDEFTASVIPQLKSNLKAVAQSGPTPAQSQRLNAMMAQVLEVEQRAAQLSVALRSRSSIATTQTASMNATSNPQNANTPSASSEQPTNPGSYQGLMVTADSFGFLGAGYFWQEGSGLHAFTLDLTLAFATAPDLNVDNPDSVVMEAYLGYGLNAIHTPSTKWMFEAALGSTLVLPNSTGGLYLKTGSTLHLGAFFLSSHLFAPLVMSEDSTSLLQEMGARSQLSSGDSAVSYFRAGIGYSF